MNKFSERSRKSYNHTPEEIIEVFERAGFMKVKTAINGHIQIVVLQKTRH